MKSLSSQLEKSELTSLVESILDGIDSARIENQTKLKKLIEDTLPDIIKKHPGKEQCDGFLRMYSSKYDSPFWGCGLTSDYAKSLRNKVKRCGYKLIAINDGADHFYIFTNNLSANKNDFFQWELEKDQDVDFAIITREGSMASACIILKGELQYINL